MIDPPPLIGPASPLRRVEKSSRDREPGREGGHGYKQREQEEREPEQEGGDGLHVDVRV
ncbi:MAG TPA: hypothetical protein VHC67_02855 [Gaiellaceae bacterium]|jgi:hypothetical protein|nr:hypothetical protein [Gaiellaceae bacterium]